MGVWMEMAGQERYRKVCAGRLGSKEMGLNQRGGKGSLLWVELGKRDS